MPYKKPVKDCIDCGCALDLEARRKGAYSTGRRCRPCYIKNIDKKRRNLKSKAVRASGSRCADCNQSFPDCVYDFHHVDGTKDGCIGTMTHNCRPWSIIEEEINKCVMLCANCHRMRHFN